MQPPFHLAFPVDDLEKGLTQDDLLPLPMDDANSTV